jgi:phage protein U
MYAQLGNIKFEALKGFETFTQDDEANYAQHALIKGKPKIERVGTNLKQIELAIMLHSAFTVPENDIAALQTSRINGDILTLTLGTGEVIADFVITKLKQTTNKTDGDGRLVWVNIEVSLLECPSGDKLTKKQQRARDNAFAVGNVPSRTITELKPGTADSAVVMQKVAEGQVAVSKANKAVQKLKQGYQAVDKTAKDVTKAINKANDSFTKARELVLNNPQLNTLAADLAEALGAATSLGTNVLGTVAPLTSVAGLSDANDALRNQMQVLNAKASPVAGLGALRKFL